MTTHGWAGSVAVDEVVAVVDPSVDFEPELHPVSSPAATASNAREVVPPIPMVER
jgi:hypothetical protein